MTIRGEPTDYWVRSQFRVEIDGLVYAGFRDCTEIGGEIETVKHREGGSNKEFKKPGVETYPPVTLTAGLSDMPNELYDWWNLGRQGGEDKAVNRGDLNRTVTIIQMDEEGNDVYQWILYEAWARVYKAGGFDKGASEVTVKTLEIEFEWFDEESLVTT